MEIWAKSVLNTKELDARMKDNVDGIEIALMKDFIDIRNPLPMSLDKILHYPIKAIHLPQPFVNLEAILYDYPDILMRTCLIADALGLRWGWKVNVIVHSELKHNDWYSHGALGDFILEPLDMLLSTFHNVVICIENVEPLKSIDSISKFSFVNNILADNVKLAKDLCDALDTDRVATCLDTCHAMMTEAILKRVSKFIGDESKIQFTLEDHFKAAKETCRQIHLATFRGNGFGWNHGMGFTEEFDTVKDLKKILKHYDKYLPGTPLVLEVQEKDYLNAPIFLESRKHVKEYYSNKGGAKHANMGKVSSK